VLTIVWGMKIGCPNETSKDLVGVEIDGDGDSGSKSSTGKSEGRDSSSSSEYFSSIY